MRGAAELTSNPDVLVRALGKIGRQASCDAPSLMEAFLLENPVASRLFDPSLGCRARGSPAPYAELQRPRHLNGA